MNACFNLLDHLLEEWLWHETDFLHAVLVVAKVVEALGDGGRGHGRPGHVEDEAEVLRGHPLHEELLVTEEGGQEPEGLEGHPRVSRLAGVDRPREELLDLVRRPGRVRAEDVGQKLENKFNAYGSNFKVYHQLLTSWYSAMGVKTRKM